MNKVIIAGDFHLNKIIGNIGKVALGSSLNSRVIDQLNLLDFLLDQAIEEQASHIIMTGDILEHPKETASIITLFISWLKKCQANNIKVEIVIGNHDILRSGNFYTSPLDVIIEAEMEGVSIYKDMTTLTINKTAITFMPFRDRKSFFTLSNTEALNLLQDSLIYELASIPTHYNKMVIGHLALEGSIHCGDEFDDLENELFCPLSMFNGYDTVFFGHVHRFQILQEANPLIAHIGSMDISNFGEADQTKYIVIYDTLTGKHETRPLPTRPLQKISIQVPADTEDPTAYVLKEIEKTGIKDKSIVRVDVSLTTPELKSINRQTIENFLTNKGVFNVTGVSESRKTILIKKDNANIDSKMDVSAAIKTYADTYIEENLKSEYISLAMEIYSNFNDA